MQINSLSFKINILYYFVIGLLLLMDELNRLHKIIIMHKSNTLLYHDHILSNIDSLDKRKDGYINHRLEFLHQHCLPVRNKIDAIKQDIVFYENMRDTAYQVIQSESDIMLLKSQIKQYKQTNKYYDQKLDQFNRSIAYLQINLQQRGRVLASKKQQIRHLFTLNGSKSTLQSNLYKRKINEFRIGSNATMKTNESRNSQGQFKKIKHFNQNITLSSQNMQRQEVVLNQQQEQKIEKLPRLEFKKAYLNYNSIMKQKQKQRHERNKDRIDKIIEKSHHFKSLNVSRFFNEEQSQQIQINPESIEEIKQIITQFDHTQALFRECFERKKLSIQKSVSQLQPKLISNKQLFLKACGVIGEKEGTFSFEEFSKLTTDELTTLFISFSWLGRKLYHEFSNNKRKDLTGLSRTIKKIQQRKTQK